MTSLLKFAAKLGAVGGSVYYTSSIGVWGDGSNAEHVYRTVYSLTAPYLKDVPVEIPDLPRVTEMTSFLKNSWNSGVLATFKFLMHLPEHTATLAKEGYEMIATQINPPTETS